jgi:ElaB/YqjD/DUF883 family membrane-anchored ribosome-binding protein
VSLESVEQAKRNTVRARARLESTLGAVQQRLHPSSLAGEAWDGVKDKSADLADGALQAVRKRPAIASAAIGALALFLAREPIRRAVTRMVSGDDSGIDSGDAELSEAEADEGVS